MSKPLMTQAPTNDKYSLNIQEVKKFLDVLLLAISLILDKLFNPYLGVPDTSIKALAWCFRCFATISFLKTKQGENPKHSVS